METKRDRLAMATITVRPPYPEKLMVTLTVKPNVSFEKQPVVVRGKMRRDEQPMGPEYATVVAEGGPAAKSAVKFECNVLEGAFRGSGEHAGLCPAGRLSDAGQDTRLCP